MPFNGTITPTDFARNFDRISHILRSYLIFHLCLNHAYYPFVTFDKSATLMAIILLKQSPPLSFIPRSTTATVSLLIFLAVNLTAFD